MAQRNKIYIRLRILVSREFIVSFDVLKAKSMIY